MFDKLQQIIKEYNILTDELSKPDIVSNINKYKKLTREEKHLSSIIPKAKQYIKKYKQLKEDEQIFKEDDQELKELVKDEIVELKQELAALENVLKVMLLPRDPNDDKNTILEIRSGTGGNEAALFAEDLYRMYLRFCENHKLKYEILSLSSNEGGGIKEVIFVKLIQKV